MSTHTTLDFVQFLLDRKLIDDSSAERTRRRSRSERKPLGEILVFNHALSVAQVMLILEAQIDHPNKRFGELAIEMGHISTIQLEDALQRQGRSNKHQLEIIREEGGVTTPALAEATVAYVRMLELQLFSSAA